jgi:hypothetical protein
MSSNQYSNPKTKHSRVTVNPTLPQSNDRQVLVLAPIFPRLKGGSYEKVLFVCLCVIRSKEHCRPGYKLRELSVVSEVIPHEELRSEGRLSRKPIGRPGTNGNRVRRKHVILGYLGAGNTNLAPKHLETPLVDQKPMEIELAGKLLPFVD